MAEGAMVASPFTGPISQLTETNRYPRMGAKQKP